MYENLTRKSIIAIVFLVFSSQLCILSYDLGNDYSMELENLLQFRKHACHKPTKVLMSRFLIENVSQIVVFVLYFLFFYSRGSWIADRPCFGECVTVLTDTISATIRPLTPTDSLPVSESKSSQVNKVKVQILQRMNVCWWKK